MAESTTGAPADRELLQRCLANEPAAVQQFQNEYGELIYGYPMRVYRMPREAAGDFYVYAFDEGRVFRRARTFEGRTTLRAYLQGYVLDNLILEWKRGEREVETVPLDALNEIADTRFALEADDEIDTVSEGANLSQVLAEMGSAKLVLFKLLYVEDSDLTADDLRYVRKVSGRRIPEILAEVERLRTIVREREAGMKRVEDAAEGVHAWIQLYQRRLRRISEDLAALPPESTSSAVLREEQGEFERKLVWRERQRAALVDRAQRRKVTAPYKEIAALLGTTVGNIASQILRLRRDLAARTGMQFESMKPEGADE